MLIQDVIKQYDAGTLLANTDETLEGVRSQLDKIVTSLTEMGKLSLRTSQMTRPTTSKELQRISDLISSTLTNRYGCND